MSHPSDPLDLKEKERLAQALRELAGHIVANEIPGEVLVPMAEQVERFVTRLAEFPKRTRSVGVRQGGEGEPERIYDYGSMRGYSPSVGTANPIAPPLELFSEGDHAVACARYGSAYEGPPGLVHGGFVAAAFDELFGLAQALASPHPGMTGTITVRYRAPVLLHTQVRYEGWVDRIEGRKMFAVASAMAGEALLAEAEAIMIMIDPAKYAAFADARNEG